MNGMSSNWRSVSAAAIAGEHAGGRFHVRHREYHPSCHCRRGKNFFRVEAGLDEISDRLRPGMEGVAKIQIGERLLAWIWTHRIIDWFRLWFWSWWP
jgi:hypothetical protein